MKNADLWKDYQEYTKTVTELARKLGFAAAAICWFFKDAQNVFPRLISAALFAVVLYFICDMLQFLAGAVMLRCWTRHKEKKLWAETQSIEGEYEKPAWLDYASYILWWAKVVFLLVAFGIIATHILRINRI